MQSGVIRVEIGKGKENMLEDYDVAIEIMGNCDDAALLRDVIEAAETDAAQIDWHMGADDQDILEAMTAAAQEGRVLTLVKSQTMGLFGETRKACQEAGLHYVVSYGVSGEEDFREGIFYRAGGDEFQIPLDVANEVVPMRDVREAAAKGFEAIKEMIAEYDRKALKDVPKELAVSAEVLEALTSELGVRR